MENEYLTVNEVADILNITKQAVYQRIKTDLSKYVINIENKIKLLNKDILNEFNKNNKELESSSWIKVLEEKLNSKDELINNLKEQVNLFNKILTEQTEERRETNYKLIKLIEQNNELNKNNQILISQLQPQVQLNDKEENFNIINNEQRIKL